MPPERLSGYGQVPEALAHRSRLEVPISPAEKAALRAAPKFHGLPMAAAARAAIARYSGAKTRKMLDAYHREAASVKRR